VHRVDGDLGRSEVDFKLFEAKPITFVYQVLLYLLVLRDFPLDQSVNVFRQFFLSLLVVHAESVLNAFGLLLRING
jgi:hypothetical protein